MNERFAADWLSLREPADHAARSHPLLERLRGAWCSGREPLRIVDLGSGTGSNLRYLAPRLPAPQHWRLVDHDPELLGRVRPPATAGRLSLRTEQADLRDWELPATGTDLVTASALLDLVSADWLGRLVRACAGHGAAALLVLSYDGDVTWTVPDPGDAFVRAAVNAHQERDKGLGAALGPRATTEAATRFREAGYRVWIEPSPWHLDSGSLPLARQLIAGWINAAEEAFPEQAGTLRAWGARRLEDLRSGRTRLQVGHRDLLALPDAPR
ncbi:MAG: class I SAM-dependent methyltransferase [Thioalkalivibrio sp.]|nr:MAG: class I SAM-dependent methyltransferase [Thioalkalivibrio sp.]